MMSNNQFNEGCHLLYAVIINGKETSVLKIASEVELNDVKTDEGYANFVNYLTETNPTWNDIKNGKITVVLFDAETLEAIRINP